MGNTNDGTDSGIRYKKCPECFAKLPLEATNCHECGQKVLDVDKFGFAKKPIDWIRYTLVVVSWTALAYFVWWAFVRIK